MSNETSMYNSSDSILEKWMMKLFPYSEKGCINFGFWKDIEEPLNIHKRVSSQKALYFELFKRLDSKINNVLEIGCGRGHGIFWLKELGFHSLGVDPLLSQIKLCQKNYPSLSDRFLQGSAEKVPFMDKSFDCLISLEAAQHFNVFEDFAKEAYRILNYKGRLILSTFFLNLEEGEEKLKKHIPPNIEGYHNSIFFGEAVSFLKNAGFKVNAPIRIGEYIFPFYAKWQKLRLGNESANSLSSKRAKHKNYYTGGGFGDHPWLLAFKEKLIDYFILEAEKE